VTTVPSTIAGRRLVPLIEDGRRSPGGPGEVEWFDLIYHERESTRGIPA
jgi:hypothetical protein